MNGAPLADPAPGDRVPVSRSVAVREAIAALETMGLVVVRVGSGVDVAPPDLRAPPWRFADRCSPRDVYEARLGLEGYAARLAAELSFTLHLRTRGEEAEAKRHRNGKARRWVVAAAHSWTDRFYDLLIRRCESLKTTSL